MNLKIREEFKPSLHFQGLPGDQHPPDTCRVGEQVGLWFLLVLLLYLQFGMERYNFLTLFLLGGGVKLTPPYLKWHGQGFFKMYILSISGHFFAQTF